MSKTKNQVIDQMNENNNQVNNRQQDVNRMTMETISRLTSAAYQAMKEVQGDRTQSDVVLQSEVYGDLWNVSVLGYNRFLQTERKNMEYRKHSLHDLLKELYQRMQMFYHYAVAEGADLPGIKWSMEQGKYERPTIEPQQADGEYFVLHLGECALNLEHSFIDPNDIICDRPTEGRLIAIRLNLGLLQEEDPEVGESHLWDEYDEFLDFQTEFDDEKDIRNVYPCEYSHERAIRDTLAQLDVIKNMNEQAEKK